MNRKHKFPCGEHYKTPIKINGKNQFWTQEELDKMYVSTCADCREIYKLPGNNSLFRLKWWHRKVVFNWWIFSMGRYPLLKHAWWTYKNKGLWKTVKVLFWNRYHMDQYQTLALPFITVHWYPLEMNDIREGWIDLSRYLPANPLPEPRFKEHNEDTRHLIKVALRYQRMFEVELKLKSRYCNYNGKGDGKCEYETYGCEIPHSIDFLHGMKGNKIIFKEWWRQK